MGFRIKAHYTSFTKIENFLFVHERNLYNRHPSRVLFYAVGNANETFTERDNSQWANMLYVCVYSGELNKSQISTSITRAILNNAISSKSFPAEI